MIVGTDVVHARSDEGDDTDQHDRNRDGKSNKTFSRDFHKTYSTISLRDHDRTNGATAHSLVTVQ
jgi:hypothetical protein